jgi:hypothetical protein
LPENFDNRHDSDVGRSIGQAVGADGGHFKCQVE